VRTAVDGEERYGRRSATAMRALGRASGETVVPGERTSTAAYRQPSGTDASGTGSRWTSRVRSTRFDDPVIEHTGARVEARLLLAIERQARIGHLDKHGGVRWVGVAVVTAIAGHDHHVRLRLRFLVQRDGILDAHSPTRAEGDAQRVRRETDRRRVGTPLRLADDQLAGDQLDGLSGPEDAQLSEAIVFLSGPAPPLKRQRLHCARWYRPTMPASTSGALADRRRMRYQRG